MNYHDEYSSRLGFLNSQLELYKIEFSETDNNKYLEVMNELNKTIKFLKKCDRAMKIAYKKKD